MTDPITDQEPTPADTLAEVHHGVAAGLLRCPRSV